MLIEGDSQSTQIQVSKKDIYFFLLKFQRKILTLGLFS